ncbi:MAG: SDR family NAD(P)-dependent oxidoreductase, partial [Desulfobacteraceae bacterium]
WLVFVDELGIGDGLIENLKEKNQRVITVKASDQYTAKNEHTFSINPGVRENYDSLFDTLKSNNLTPTKIIHLWSVYKQNNSNTYENEFEKAQKLGCYSVLYLTQALNKMDFSENMQIDIISNNMQEVTGEEELYPEKATLLGPITVIPQECQGIECRSIDIDLAEDDSRKKIIENLLLEIKSKTDDPIIAYRKEKRRVRNIRSVHVKKTAGRYRIKEKGVYLITGGLGNIGLELAEYLANTLEIRIVLTGRSSFPEKAEWDTWLSTHKSGDNITRKIQKLQRIEDLGSEVMVANADIANIHEMEKLFLQVEERFGHIDGVFHAAGIVNNEAFKTIYDIRKEDFENHYEPKIKGTLILEEILKNRKYDFCFLFSSLSSILGGIGYSAYSASNLFMDSFVRKYNRTSKQLWIGVNFDGWLFNIEEIKEQTKPTSKIEELTMTAKEGIKVIDNILLSNYFDQLIVSTGDLQHRYSQWVKLDHKQKLKKPNNKEIYLQKHSRPELSVPYIEPISEMEKIVANVWQNLLGIQKVGSEDDFFDLGGDSLLAVQIINIFKESHGINIPINCVFENSTLRYLASEIEKYLWILDEDMVDEESKLIDREEGEL